MKELVPTSGLIGLRETIEEWNGDFERIAKEAGISPSLFGMRDGYVPTRKVQAFAAIAARVLRRPDFGLLWGARSDLVFMGPLHIAFTNAKTVRAAMQILCTYTHTVNSVLRVTLGPGPEPATTLLGMVNTMARPPSLVQTMERNLVVVMRMLRCVLGPRYKPQQVFIKHSRSGPESAYVKAFGVVPLFEQRVYGFVVKTKDTNHSITERDTRLFEMAEGYLRQHAGQADSDGRLIEAVQVLAKTGEYSVEGLSEVVGVHSRTLQRRLRSAGISFAKLRDDARRAQAEQLLQRSEQSVTAIALELGYSDLTSFSHSCRRWFGMSPTAFRRQVGQLQAGASIARKNPLVVARRLRRTPKGA
jgi:AraC-like DNA-binding protein